MNIIMRLMLVVAMLMTGLSLSADAQRLLDIYGTVSDDRGQPVAGATVFLANTQRITSSDSKGTFFFHKITAGSYQIVIKMLGFSAKYKQILVKNGMPAIALTLSRESIEINEIKITTTDPDFKDKLKIFRDNFLGLSKNGRNCIIVNPKTLRLKYNHARRILAGYSTDYLTIENTLLGYRLKYWLKAFEYNYAMGITNYDGDMNFEEMSGTPEQTRQWKENRLRAYKGSMPHFLRSVYAGSNGPLREGFVTRRIVGGTEDVRNDGLNSRMRPPIMVDGGPVKFDTIVSVVDTALISLRFSSSLAVTYNENLAAKAGGLAINVETRIPFGTNTSLLKLVLPEALVDSKGNFTDYRAFLIRGRWADMRIGDMLPLDYEP